MTTNSIPSLASLPIEAIPGAGVPLGSPLRSYMEGRLGTDFGGVRLHTGPAAAAMARGLQARAFTFGRDIVFGAGAYAPQTPEGLRLLAHELVHVVQQRNSARRRPVGLGAADDNYEAEADRVADRVLAGGRLPPITTDHAGVIRRALQIDPATVDMTADITGAVHAVTLVPPANPTAALLHLTKGANTSTAALVPFTQAYTIKGGLDILLQNASDRAGWGFNILQFANLMVSSSQYGGRTDAEGSVLFNFAVKPAFPTNPSLDSDASFLPFTNLLSSTETNSSPGPPMRITLERTLMDHPHLLQPLIVPNVAANCYNYLYNLRMDIELTHILVAQELQKPFQFLAHMTLHIIFDAKFQWAGGSCLGGTLVTKRLDGANKFTVGMPPTATHANLQTLLATPAATLSQGPLFNDLCATAQKQAIGQEATTRDPTIQPNFYS